MPNKLLLFYDEFAKIKGGFEGKRGMGIMIPRVNTNKGEQEDGREH